MNKHVHINLALLAIIVILLLVVTTSTNDDETTKLKRVSDIDPKTITSIKVIRKDKPTLEFNKQPAGWRMQSPLQFRVNTARINAMLRILGTESHSELDPDQVELARFELDDPAITLQLNGYVFKFGTTDGIDQRRYLLFNNRIFMVNDFLYAQLDSKPGFFADTRLVAEDKTITAITFPENRFELVDGNWEMQQLMDIKPEQLKELAFSWKNAEAISVSSYQQPQQEFPITITTADKQSMTFNIIATSPYLILGRKDLAIQYHMASDDAAKLLLQDAPGTEAQP